MPRCCWYHKGTNFQANHNANFATPNSNVVVADTTKVQIFKQITTACVAICARVKLLLIPQRYKFSSKSQHKVKQYRIQLVVADTTKVQIFKQITTRTASMQRGVLVVADTTKVQIFKQITTPRIYQSNGIGLLLIPQRYKFSSKSQLRGTSFTYCFVVADTTKVQIFKQITTPQSKFYSSLPLLLIPQRYKFSSKSQLRSGEHIAILRCCWYHKGTNFQANHNYCKDTITSKTVVADTTKVQIFKQITTN